MEGLCILIILRRIEFRFHLQIKGADLYVDNNFQIKVGFSAKEERDGYDEFFDMIARYELHIIEAGSRLSKLLIQRRCLFIQIWV